MRKIVTSCPYPPIPIRQYDWCAYYGGEEEAGNYGWGATEAEAIADFIENYADDHDERLDGPTAGEILIDRLLMIAGTVAVFALLIGRYSLPDTMHIGGMF